MSIPKNPRQAMINMMYLVYTALLALNISAETLNAFLTVDNGLQKTTATLDSNISEVYQVFKERAERDSSALPLYNKALKAREIATNLIAEIERMKNEMIEISGGEEVNGKLEPKNHRDTNTPTYYFVNEGHGDELQQKIKEARQKFLQLFDEDIRAEKETTITLNAESPTQGESLEKKSWAEHNFADVPIVAAVTILSKIENDAKTTEAAVVEWLKSQIGLQSVDFDVLKARAIPKKAYLNLGETYEADIFVSASSSSTQPKVYLGEFDPQYIKRDENGELPVEVEADKIPLLPGYKELADAVNGIVKYQVQTSSVGPKTYRGVIEVLNAKTGTVKYYPFESEYLVAQSQAVVSPTKMNVLYIGVDNPLDVSVPGYPASSVSASLSQGTITGGNGKYIARVNSTGEVRVNVSVRTESGYKTVGSVPFRAKRIPDPKVMLGNSSGPVIQAGQLRAMPGLVAIADNFPFDVNFNIRGFEVTYKKRGSNELIVKQNPGKIFTNEVKQLFNQARPGDRVWFDNIKVAAPDGTTRTKSLSFKVIGG